MIVSPPFTGKVEKPTPAKKQESVTPDDSEEEDEDESESEEESSSEEESESEESSSSDDDDRPATEKARERALARIAVSDRSNSFLGSNIFSKVKKGEGKKGDGLHISTL
jgi:hypothetical protein